MIGFTFGVYIIVIAMRAEAHGGFSHLNIEWFLCERASGEGLTSPEWRATWISVLAVRNCNR